VAGFTGLLFIATAGLWFFTALLWQTTARAVADGEKGVEAATKAALAAERSAEVAVTTLRDLERPYVFVSDIWLTRVGGESVVPHITFDLTNHGRTPAVMRKLTARLRLVETADEQMQAVDETATLLISRVIGAGQSIDELKFAHEWLGDAYESIQWSILRAYVDITIWYDDVFDNQPELIGPTTFSIPRCGSLRAPRISLNSIITLRTQRRNNPARTSENRDGWLRTLTAHTSDAEVVNCPVCCIRHVVAGAT
jgi:hypothetical protein